MTGLAGTAQAAPSSSVDLNVVLKGDITPARLAALAKYGTVTSQLPEIDGLTLKTKEASVAAVRGLDFVAAANPDAKRVGKPVPAVQYDGDAALATWDLDQIDVAKSGGGAGLGSREVDQTGAGVYVAVLDTGLLSTWRAYFPEASIATQYAKSFGGGGAQGTGATSEQPNKWQTDQNSHGTHVTSTILGYNFGGTRVMGVAPDAKVIPVKVLNNNGSGQSSMVAAGITYIGDLKADALKDSPVVINMSLGGPELDALEKAAIDYAIEQGVLIVASAGNSGEAGMGYPGAYAPVISVAASGWTGEWVDPDGAGSLTNRAWWYAGNPGEGADTIAAEAYITDFSSRQKEGQDLDVAAPGSWVLGPYQTNGQLSYYYLGGTSMAAPHVTGAVALMLQKDGGLSQAEAETTLEDSAVKLDPGCRSVLPGPGATPANVCWGSDATGAGILNVPAAIAATP